MGIAVSGMLYNDDSYNTVVDFICHLYYEFPIRKESKHFRGLVFTFILLIYLGFGV